MGAPTCRSPLTAKAVSPCSAPVPGAGSSGPWPTVCSCATWEMAQSCSVDGGVTSAPSKPSGRDQSAPGYRSPDGGRLPQKMAGGPLDYRVEGGRGLGPASGDPGCCPSRALGSGRPHGLSAVAALARQASQTGQLVECFHPPAAVRLGGGRPAAQTGCMPTSPQGSHPSAPGKGGPLPAPCAAA